MLEILHPHPQHHDASQSVLTSFSDIMPGMVCGVVPSEMTSTSSGLTSCRDSWELASGSPSWAMLVRLRLREPAGGGGARCRVIVVTADAAEEAGSQEVLFSLLNTVTHTHTMKH